MLSAGVKLLPSPEILERSVGDVEFKKTRSPTKWPPVKPLKARSCSKVKASGRARPKKAKAASQPLRPVAKSSRMTRIPNPAIVNWGDIRKRSFNDITLPTVTGKLPSGWVFPG